jgi:hypothetical protein
VSKKLKIIVSGELKCSKHGVHILVGGVFDCCWHRVAEYAMDEPEAV